MYGAGVARPVWLSSMASSAATVAQACKTLPVGPAGKAAWCRSWPHVASVCLTFSARSWNTPLGQIAYCSRYHRSSSASIGPSGAVKAHEAVLCTSRLPDVAGS
jgi:hypothetical protein